MQSWNFLNKVSYITSSPPPFPSYSFSSPSSCSFFLPSSFFYSPTPAVSFFFSSFIFSPSSFSSYPPHPLPIAKLLFLCLFLTLLLPFPPTFYTSIIFLLYDPHSSAILIYLYQSKLRFQNVLVYTCRYSVYTVQCSSETCELNEHISNVFETPLKCVCLGV